MTIPISTTTPPSPNSAKPTAPSGTPSKTSGPSSGGGEPNDPDETESEPALTNRKITDTQMPNPARIISSPSTITTRPAPFPVASRVIASPSGVVNS
ncbi:hypothetical protein MUY14_15575 [Amycolatopsis sp. FBCC-B4732]|uniref:hypothetical protein n=1 Tax=Amycolatopsis sp. FBCC-B4732 TaxID=3079339 RepID=UPI001FF4513F|nr:hypothetical protein [Amycolatopsis sp. FBCC-B4732]UOX91975.1 hypothetical protein MUY14_15575 [Amycolatopsis sp. FBCC-B4732]